MNAVLNGTADNASPAFFAMQYGRIGWHVLPIAPRDKHPTLKAWETGASADTSTIRAWWKSRPSAGIGVHCGMSGLVVIDVDPRNGGSETIAALEVEHGPLWDTGCLIARTGGNGWHYVLKAPAGVALPHSLGAGVDLLHGNRYFIVAPSVHPSGKAYAWNEGCRPFDAAALAAMPDLPAWAHTGPAVAVATEEADPLAIIDNRQPDAPEDRQRVRSALAAIDPHCDRANYLRTLIALRSTGWHDWQDLARKWASGAMHDREESKFIDKHFKRDCKGLKVDGGVSIASLFHLAKAAGWNDSRTIEPKASQSIDDGEVILTRAADIEPQPIDWLWLEWLPRGKMTVNAGAPGTGKTTIAMTAAAIVSTGGTWPDGTHCPTGNVLIWSGEDDPKDTLVPRLIAAGADLTRIRFVGDTSDGLERRPFDPAKDMPALLLSAEALGNVSLFIVDPIVSAVAGDSHKNAEVRRALAPLVEFAERCRAALLGISHFTKGTAGRDPLERVTGSVAFGAIARLVWVTARTENEAGEVVRVLARAKSNIGPDDGGFSYTFEQVELADHPGITASKVSWGEALIGRARDLLAEREEPRPVTKVEDAGEWLREQLASGPVLVNDIKARAKAAGHSWRTLERANKWLRVRSERSGKGNKAPHQWALPGPEDDSDEL